MYTGITKPSPRGNSPVGRNHKTLMGCIIGGEKLGEVESVVDGKQVTITAYSAELSKFDESGDEPVLFV